MRGAGILWDEGSWHPVDEGKVQCPGSKGRPWMSTEEQARVTLCGEAVEAGGGGRDGQVPSRG